jgi:hypothetical protein
LGRHQLDLRPDAARPGHDRGILDFSEAQLLRHAEEHALVVALLEYRRIEEAARAFAPPDVYRRIRDGRVAVPFSLVLTARLSNGSGGATERTRDDDA